MGGRKKHKRFKEDNTENSKNFKQAKLKLVREFKKISNRMKDRNHKLSRKLVNIFDLIAYEDLKLKKMSEKKPNQKRKINKYTVKSLQQASLMQETGKQIVFINPKDTF
jgi:putative transposase